MEETTKTSIKKEKIKHLILFILIIVEIAIIIFLIKYNCAIIKNNIEYRNALI